MKERSISSTLSSIVKCAGLLVFGSVIICVGIAQEPKRTQQQANQPAQQQCQRASPSQQNGQANAQRTSKSGATDEASNEPNPYAKPDAAWISLSRTVGMVQPHAFTLDYGDGTIRVEMDDGD